MQRRMAKNFDGRKRKPTPRRQRKNMRRRLLGEQAELLGQLTSLRECTSSTAG